MNLSIKICDLCDTCVYHGEYQIIEDEIICVMCIEEEEGEDEISGRRMGDVRSIR